MNKFVIPSTRLTCNTFWYNCLRPLMYWFHSQNYITRLAFNCIHISPHGTTTGFFWRSGYHFKFYLLHQELKLYVLSCRRSSVIATACVFGEICIMVYSFSTAKIELQTFGNFFYQTSWLQKTKELKKKYVTLESN